MLQSITLYLPTNSFTKLTTYLNLGLSAKPIAIKKASDTNIRGFSIFKHVLS